MVLPVGISWSTSRQTRATTHNHQQILEMLVEVIDQLKMRTDLVQRMVNGTTLTTTFYANLATEKPTTTSSRSTSPKG